MKKICMIAPKNLPLPAVKWGSIETLITNVIDENEIEKKNGFNCGFYIQ